MTIGRHLHQISAFRGLLAIVFVLSSLVNWAQDKTLRLDIVVKDQETRKNLPGVQVIIYQNGNEFDVLDCGTSGKAKSSMNLGSVFDVKVTCSGYIQKIIRFDMRNIPPEDQADGFNFPFEISLFKFVDGFNLDIVKEPLAVCRYQTELDDINWDMEHFQQQQKRIEDELKRLQRLKTDGDQAKIDFDKLMLEGDAAMAAKKYQEAMGKYEGALKIFANDAVAKQKYADAKAKYEAELAAAGENAAYQKLIADGDAFMKSKKYEDARKAYTDASKKKPAEKYPKERLFEIGELLKNSEKQAQYDALIAEADKKFDGKDWQNAINKYKDASTVLPSVAYPKEQIAKAQAAMDAALATAKEEAQKEERYNELLRLGEKNFNDKKYDGALLNYRDAAKVKPEEKFPPQRIAEIEALLAELELQRKEKEELDRKNNELAELERRYNVAIQKADGFFNSDDLEGARAAYQDASAVKPAEKYPQTRITEIEELIADRAKQRAMEAENAAVAQKNAEIDAEYQRRIQTADGLFRTDKWEEAIPAYELALEVKPLEKYPSSKIAEIRMLIEERERKLKEDEDNARLAEEARRNAERLAAEEDRLNRERSEAQAKAEAERLAREQEETERQRRLAEEALERARKDAEMREKMAALDNNKEDDVERYYREAKELEDKSKYDKVVRESEGAATYMKEVEARTFLLSKQALNEARDMGEAMSQLQVAGDARKIQSTAEILRRKEQAQRDLTTYASGAEGRLGLALEYADQDKKKAATSGGDNKKAEQNAEMMAQKKDYYNETTKMYESRGATTVVSNKREVEREKTEQQEQSFEGEKAREEKEQEVEEKKQEVAARETDNQAAANSRREMNEDVAVEEKRRLEVVGQTQEAAREQRVLEAEQKKQKAELSGFKASANAEQKAYDRRKSLYSRNPGREKSPEEYQASPGSEMLAEGVTERSFELGNKNITERTMKVGNKVDVYRKCVSKYGIAYFKNGRSITRERWMQETTMTEE
jgi:hypothetical protein